MVEWKKIVEVCKLERGVRVVKKELQEEGQIPVYQNSLTPLGFYEKNNYPKNTPFVICAGAAGEIGYSDKAFWAADDCTCIVCSSINSKYVYYCLMVKQHLLKSQVRKASVPRLSKDVIGKIQIPIPSLFEQTRIVGILDTFTASIENLKEQIVERRKQYEHYRDQLLDLKGKPGVEMKKVAYFVKERILANELTAQNYTSVENLLKDKAGRKDAENVPSEGNWIRYQKGDVLIGNIRPYLRKIWLSDREGGTNGDVIVIRSNDTLLPEFMFYCLASDSFFLYYNQALKDGKMPRGEKKRVLSYVIPSVGKEEQQRIVSILDTFEASIQNLEAQLKQREKQYEYYRNKLLTFE